MSIIVPSCRLILETDPQTVAARVTMRGADGEVPIAEQVSSSNSLKVQPMAAKGSACPCYSTDCESCVPEGRQNNADVPVAWCATT